MKKNVFLFFMIFCSCSFYEEKKSTHNRDVVYVAALLRLMSNVPATTTSTTCSSTVSFSCASTPSFNTLAVAGTTGSCATSGCHTNVSQQAGLDISDYNSAKGFTIPGNPCASRMYTAITTGAMVGNSNSLIRQAVYCWIAGGSSP
ncbi:MAG: hypothetical protein K8R21_15010 [Leptospira sp.]|nr:hypothetical protein [Leptospira sp.]